MKKTTTLTVKDLDTNCLNMLLLYIEIDPYSGYILSFKLSFSSDRNDNEE